MKNLILAAIAAFFVSGCGGQPLSPDSQFALQYAFQKTTGDIVQGDPIKAQRVREIAADIRHYAENEELLTVDVALAYIESQIPWDRLDAADQGLARHLLKRWRDDLIEQFGADAVAEDLRVTVIAVTEWAILAARP